ncbi:hypothetical protein [Actinomadura sp. HBU206391]|uniref:hypothetical protein n=1 Tax=Actinomadura sp. HBU206391 TaxID=2731692 RepID=UPI00164F6210|nr:hypothetical protein [Actinomadura sp. HBU206391]MBC6456720.1 hypothetical protein [Actinomadura sp. HBU206391]
MGSKDDFGQWEREFDEPEVGSGHRAVAVMAVAVPIGCAFLFLIGQVPLAIAGLVVSGLIMALWWVGM